VAITPIGRITEPGPDNEARVELKLPDGSVQPLDAGLGWEHGDKR